MKMTLIGCLLVIVLAACNAKPESTLLFENLPTEGDAVQGAILFAQGTGGSTPCLSCHNETGLASPNLDGYGERAGQRVEGEDAREYTFYSITEPWKFIVEGYGNAMPNNYDEKLTPQNIADLIAYLMLR